MAKPVCLSDFERLARKVLPKYAYDFYASGANDGFTLKDNCLAYGRYALALYFAFVFFLVNSKLSYCVFLLFSV